MAKVRRVTILEAGEDGQLNVVGETTKRKRKRNRKTSSLGEAPERNMRVGLKAMRIFVDEMDRRHDRSSRKKKDGWMVDLGKNSFNANRKAMKKLRKLRMF